LAKTRLNFTLSKDTQDLLDKVDNKSETVEKAVKHFLLNKPNEKPGMPQTIAIKRIRL